MPLQTSPSTQLTRKPDDSPPEHQLVSVDRLSLICNPLRNPPWEEVCHLDVDFVRQAVAEGAHYPFPYTGTKRKWSAEDHVLRIGFLVASGWSDPIVLDVGIPALNCFVDWPITDGNHRFAAAMVRGDAYILASVSGCCSYIEELFGGSPCYA